MGSRTVTRGYGKRIASSLLRQCPAMDALEPRLLLSSTGIVPPVVHLYAADTTDQSSVLAVDLEPPLVTDSGTWTEVTAESGLASCETLSASAMQVDLSLVLVEITTLPNGEHRISSPGLFASGEGGTPELPERLLRFALPPDADLDSVCMEFLSNDARGIEGAYGIAPAPLSTTTQPRSPAACRAAPTRSA